MQLLLPLRRRLEVTFDARRRSDDVATVLDVSHRAVLLSCSLFYVPALVRDPDVSLLQACQRRDWLIHKKECKDLQRNAAAKGRHGPPDVVLRALSRVLYLRESERDGKMVRWAVPSC